MALMCSTGCQVLLRTSPAWAFDRRHLGHKFGVFAPGMSVSRPELVPQVVRAASRPEMTSLLETATGRHGEKARPGVKPAGEGVAGKEASGVNATAEKKRPRGTGEAGGRAGRRGSA